MNIVRMGSVREPHMDFTTGMPCVVPPRCDAQGAYSGKTCPNPVVQWQDIEDPNLHLHAHVCQQHRALKATTADMPSRRTPPNREDESHSVLYRTLVHPLVLLVIVVIMVTKVLGLW